jgi:hypothetical protein
MIDDELSTRILATLNAYHGGKCFDCFFVRGTSDERLFGFPRGADRFVISTSVGPIDKLRSFVEATFLKALRVHSIGGWADPSFEGYLVEPTEGSNLWHVLSRFSNEHDNSLELTVNEVQHAADPYFNYEFEHDAGGYSCRRAVRKSDGQVSEMQFRPPSSIQIENLIPTDIPGDWKAIRDRERKAAAALLDSIMGGK